MKLYRVIQPVSDIERATVFYHQVLGAPGDRVSPGRHYFDCGGTLLACYDPVADGDEIGEGWRQHPFQYLYFATPDLERARDSVKQAGGVLETAIESMPWGERLFYARDPFGNPICFVDEETLFLGSASERSVTR
jgi:predicted enzyme related to lactoylglutathione lyase